MAGVGMAPTLTLQNLVVRLIGDDSSFMKMTANADARMNWLAKKTFLYGRAVTSSFAIPLTLMAGLWTRNFAKLDDAVAHSMNQFAQFRKVSEGAAFTQPGGFTDYRSRARAEIEERLIDISKRSTFTANELAIALGTLGRTGYDAASAFGALRTVETFALANTLDLQQAVKSLSEAQAALGMRSADAGKNIESLGRIAQVMTGAGVLGGAAANTETLVEGLVRAAPLIRKVNMSLEESASILAVYSKQGITGVAAGDRLRYAVDALGTAAEKSDSRWKALGMGIQQTGQKMVGQMKIHSSMGQGIHTHVTGGAIAGTKAVNQYRNAWDELGLQMYDTATGKLLPFSVIVGNIEKVIGTGSDRQNKLNELMAGFDMRIQRVLLPLIGYSKELKEIEDELKMFTGMQDMAARSVEGLGARMRILLNNINAVGYSLVTLLLPALNALIDYIKIGITWFDVMDPTIKVMTMSVIGLIASLALLGGAMRIVTAFFNFMVSPITLVFNVLGAVFSGIVGFTKFMLGIGTSLLSVVIAPFKMLWSLITGIAGAFTSLASVIVGLVTAPLTALTSLFTGLIGLIPSLLSGLMSLASTLIAIAPLVFVVGGLVGLFLLMGKIDFAAMWKGFKDLVTAAFGFFYNFRENWAKLMTWIGDHWDVLLEDMGTNSWTFIKNLTKNLMVGFMTTFDLIKEWIKINWGPITDLLTAVFHAAFDSIFRRIGAEFTALQSALDAFMKNPFDPRGLRGLYKVYRDIELGDLRFAEKKAETEFEKRFPMRPFERIDIDKFNEIIEQRRKELVPITTGMGLRAPFPTLNLTLPFDPRAGRAMMALGGAIQGMGMPGPGGLIQAALAPKASEMEKVLERGTFKGTLMGAIKGMEDLTKSPLMRTAVGTDFRAINLKQFILEGPGGLSRGFDIERKQNTSDPETHDWLEKIYGVFTGQDKSVVTH